LAEAAEAVREDAGPGAEGGEEWVPAAAADCDAALNDPEAFQKMTSVRQRAYLKWARSPLSDLKCYCISVLNLPIRRCLRFIFRHEAAGVTEADAVKIKQRYLFTDDGDCLDDGEVETVPGFAVARWCTGRITQRCLDELCDCLLDDAADGPLGLAMNLFGCTEAVLSALRRAVITGVGEVWWRLHVPTQNFPMKLLGMVDQSTDDRQRRKLVVEAQHAPECCWDAFSLEGVLSEIEALLLEEEEAERADNHRFLEQISGMGFGLSLI
jgi:hypothetical protein